MDNPPGQMQWLGRLVHVDERDREYPLETLLGGPGKPPDRTQYERFYPTGPLLNQGATSQCVGYTLRQFLSSSPIMTKGGPDAEAIYREAQARDPWAAIPHEGTTLRAALSYLKEQGHIAGYYWTWSVEPAIEWVLGDRGTLIAGLPWTEGMFRPERDHFLRPTGPDLGGHAVLLSGYSSERRAFRVVNSWGPTWGDQGRAWLAVDDLRALFSIGHVELVTAVESRPGGA